MHESYRHPGSRSSGGIQPSFELVDAVPAETGRTERRLRMLPSRVGVYFVLALALFSHVGAHLVWRKLIAGLTGLTGLTAVALPSEKALRDLRRWVGWRR
ncbi:transposase domain-containing protein [Herbidospora cretacea]|uniref:transposase domain-containing protein n=1 Tax=Herbidospora cretacea TaxID=28444 RepID=UPI0018CC75AC|nr:transposase domain-containing protein [Herbidospora cretacea]